MFSLHNVFSSRSTVSLGIIVVLSQLFLLASSQHAVDIAASGARTFFNKLSNHKGDGSLEKQDFDTLNAVAGLGTVALTQAQYADILGAEIMGEVALSLATVQLIQIGKADTMSKCIPVVNSLVEDTIQGTIAHLVRLESRASLERWYGSRYNYPKNKGVLYYLTQLWEWQRWMTKEQVTQLCMGGDVTSAPLSPPDWCTLDFFPSGENLASAAFGAVASQSSTYSSDHGYADAHRAIDGNTESWGERFVSHTECTLNPWWQVKLNRIYKIGEVRVHNRSDEFMDRIHYFIVTIYKDGVEVYNSDFSKQAESSTTKLLYTFEIPGGGVMGDTVTVRLPREDCLHIAEVEVLSALDLPYDRCGVCIPSDGLCGFSVSFHGGLYEDSDCSKCCSKNRKKGVCSTLANFIARKIE